MLAGGVLAALVAVGLVASSPARQGRASAALGIVFTILFAAACSYGAVRRCPHRLRRPSRHHRQPRGPRLADGAAAGKPRSARRLARAAPCARPPWRFSALVALIVASATKELALVAFDPDFARASGLRSAALDLLLLVATALASVPLRIGRDRARRGDDRLPAGDGAAP